MEISELLDKAKTRANLASDYALAKALGIPNGNLSNIRRGKAHPSNEVAIQLATLAGLNEMEVIAWIELETAKNPKKKEFWRHYIESRGLTACVVMTALACSILITPDKANDNVLQLQNYDAKQDEIFCKPMIHNIHYANLKLMVRAVISKFFQLLNPTHHAITSPV